VVDAVDAGARRMARGKIYRWARKKKRKNEKTQRCVLEGCLRGVLLLFSVLLSLEGCWRGVGWVFGRVDSMSKGAASTTAKK